MPDASELLTPRTMRQRIGGRWAVAWQSYLITATRGRMALLAGEQDALQSVLVACAEAASELATRYGNVSKASVGTIQRQVLAQEREPVQAAQRRWRVPVRGRADCRAAAATPPAGRASGASRRATPARAATRPPCANAIRHR
mgnify:CR=1 FL=1